MNNLETSLFLEQLQRDLQGYLRRRTVGLINNEVVLASVAEAAIAVLKPHFIGSLVLPSANRPRSDSFIQSIDGVDPSTRT